MRILVAVVALLLPTLLAACVVEEGAEDLPRLRLDLDRQALSADEALEVQVRYVNTLDSAVSVEAPEGCIQVQVWTVVDGESIFLSDPGGAGCTGRPETVRIPAGETREWGPFVLRPSEYTTGTRTVFTPGTYPLLADVMGGSTAWSWHNETTFEVEEAKAGMEIEVAPEKEAFDAGETIRITARLTNTRDEPFTYTSRDGCDDIHVWAEVGEGERGQVRLFPDMEPYFCTQALTEFTIAPGESLETVVHWDGSQDGRGGPPFVAGGVYTLFAALDGQRDLPVGYGEVGVRDAEG